jgi:hypothetical protein
VVSASSPNSQAKKPPLLEWLVAATDDPASKSASAGIWHPRLFRLAHAPEEDAA